MNRPPELLKSFCNRLAQTLKSKDSRNTLQMLHSAGLLNISDGNHPLSSGQNDGIGAPPAKHARVGIWEGKREGGQTSFVRSTDSIQEWRLWAKVGRIPPKLNKLRVVLVGESTARGFLYDPQFTPAMALQSILQSHLGKGSVEVIDLARTGLCLEVKELAVSALQLEPDAIVIFAGNNWNKFASDPLALSEAMRCEGVAGMKQLRERELAAATTRIVETVASQCRAREVPLVWIVPEFNLADWREPVANAPHLFSNGNRQWVLLWQAATRALHEGDLIAATNAAQKMIELDGGVAATGFYILAECSQRSGDAASAKSYLVLARDAVIWDNSREFSPRMFSVAREVLRREAAKYKDEVVDLPEVFGEHLQGEIPDRRLFLDYCHLTVEGIQIAMSAAASCLLRILRKKEVSWTALWRQSSLPPAEVQAEAEFLAAIHNSHYHQTYEVARHHCMCSLQLYPAIAEVMRHYLDLHNWCIPMLMSTSAEKIAKFEFVSIQNYLFNAIDQKVDGVITGAILDSLKSLKTDLPGKNNQIRRRKQGVVQDKQDLLDYRYCWAAHQPQELVWALPEEFVGRRLRYSDYYKAYWLESRFFFMGEENCPVRLSLTCRLPCSSSDGFVSFVVNRQVLEKLPVSREWRTWDIAVSESLVKDGLNEISILWPLPQFPGTQFFQDFQGIQNAADLYCIFGEIHSFTASRGTAEISTRSNSIVSESEESSCAAERY